MTLASIIAADERPDQTVAILSSPETPTGHRDEQRYRIETDRQRANGTRAGAGALPAQLTRRLLVASRRLAILSRPAKTAGGSAVYFDEILRSLAADGSIRNVVSAPGIEGRGVGRYGDLS